MIGLKDVESHQTIPTRSFISWQLFACVAFIILCPLELPRLSCQCINMGRGQRCPALCSTAAPPSPSASLAWCSVHISEQLAGTPPPPQYLHPAADVISRSLLPCLFSCLLWMVERAGAGAWSEWMELLWL